MDLSYISEFIDRTDSLTGMDLFESVVLDLTIKQDLDVAFIGELNAEKTKVMTIAVAMGDVITENFDYELSATPCEQVLDRTYCHFASGVGSAFPDDKMLIEMGIEGYVGYPLITSDGGPLGILVCLKRAEITKPVELFEMLRFIARRVESELERAKLTKALKKSERQKQSAEQISSQVLSNISHEMRTPLNAILGFSAILRDRDLATSNSEAMREYLGMIHQSGKELLASISRMIELAELQSGTYGYKIDFFQLDQLVEKAISEVSKLYPQHHIQLDHDALKMSVALDPGLLLNILIQLIGNATKHSLPGTKISVGAAENAMDYSISVIDDGPGIPPERLSIVTDAFTLAEDIYNKTNGGLGLGLAYVKAASEIMGAQFTIESEHQKGTQVTIIFNKPDHQQSIA